MALLFSIQVIAFFRDLSFSHVFTFFSNKRDIRTRFDIALGLSYESVIAKSMFWQKEQLALKWVNCWILYLGLLRIGENLFI